MHVVRFEEAVCTKCNKQLACLVRDENGNWNVLTCSCGEWYDTYQYEKAGGKRVVTESIW